MHARLDIRWLAALAVAACVIPACAGAPDRIDVPASRLAQLDENPDLRARLEASVFGYFRFVNRPFADAVCAELAPFQPAFPSVNLHGDAHLEQFAVTSLGSGLVDFDDAAAGPGYLDLVRFGSSVWLTCELQGWDDAVCAPAIDALYAGYRDALADPEVAVAVPAIATEIASRFTDDRSEFFEFVDSLMQPIPEASRPEIDEGWARYVDYMKEQRPELRPEFFDIVQRGAIAAGFGSALDSKYLVRIAGPSDSPDDDLVLEAKELRDLSEISCISADSQRGSAFRVLVSRARIGRFEDPFLAPVPRGPEEPPDDAPFWVKSWYDQYVELDVTALPDATALTEVSYAVGAQLGRGHIMGIASPLDAELRRAQSDALDSYERQLRATTREMTQRMLAGWRAFRGE